MDRAVDGARAVALVKEIRSTIRGAAQGERRSSWSSRWPPRAAARHHAYVLENGRVKLSGTGAELARMPEVKRAYLGG